MVARYNADLANNLGNLLARVSAVVEQKCGGIGPAPRPDSPLAELAAGGLRDRRPGLGAGGAERGIGGYLAPRPGRQRRPGGGRALAGRARARR